MSDKEINWQKRRFWYLVAAIILFLAGVKFYYDVQRAEDIVTVDNLETIDSLVISEKPEGHRSGRGSTPTYIEFKCAGFTKDFRVDIYHYPCSNQKAIYDLRPGDTVSIKLLKSDIPGIDFETFNSTSNDVHALVYKSQNYLDLDCRNKEAKNDNKFGYLICFIMAPLMLSFSLFKTRPKFIGSIEPVIILLVIGTLVALILLNDVLK